MTPGKYSVAVESSEIIALSVRVTGDAGARSDLVLEGSPRAPAPEEVDLGSTRFVFSPSRKSSGATKAEPKRCTKVMAPRLLKRLVKLGHTGKKSGRGIYV